ncbi:hypothetical protein PanWU01x14_008830 [Parasponia andersonii]|uniref:Uncharacterized protein n=1 Tax=Parasponia andersonii TaxID=3476 RepID=A0A2P5E2A0_PARAD|nr:hypothetical protein PanWU01x14_008830 [Parasponia andersonii]
METHSRNLRRRFSTGASRLLRRILAGARRNRWIIRRGRSDRGRGFGLGAPKIGSLRQIDRPLQGLGFGGCSARLIVVFLVEIPAEFAEYAVLSIASREEVDAVDVVRVGSEVSPARLASELGPRS